MSETEHNWYEFNDPFPSEECPACDGEQPDPTHLYCDRCVARIAEERAAEMETEA